MSESRQPPVRVLQVLSQDAIGGTELQVASLVEQVDRSRVLCELAVLSPAGQIAARLRAHGIEVHALGAGVLGGTVRLARLLRARPFDVVNAYGLRGGWVTRLAARLGSPRTKVVVGIRGQTLTETERMDSSKEKLAGVLERCTSRLVDVYDANSRGGAELIRSHGVASERVRYIPNGVAVADAIDRAGRTAAEANPPLILSAARFAPVKRHADLVRALAQLHEDGLGFSAVLAGTGPTLEASRRLAGELGLTDRVEFPGSLAPESVASMLGRARVACLASLREGMPGFLMEAMAAGVAVVATDVAGIRDVVVDGETGFLVPVRDPAALRSALGEVLDDPSLAERMGAAGRARIVQELSIESMVGSKVALYEGLAAA